MKMKDLCADERPREKMLRHGARTLSSAELLAVLLRSGSGGENVLDLSRRLLSGADGHLSRLAALSPEVLCRIRGIGMAKALTLVAAFELGRRVDGERPDSVRSPVRSPADLYARMAPRLRGLDHEECWAAFLNAANGLIRAERLSSGGMDAALLDVRILTRRALEHRAKSLILLHNHPSGNPRPGPDDIRLTEVVRQALATFDILLLDHIVVCDGAYFSFSDQNLVSVQNNLV